MSVNCPFIQDTEWSYRLILGDLVASTNTALCTSPLGNTLAWAGHAAVEVHAVDTDGWVVLDAQIDVLRDTEAEVASLGEVALAEFVFLDLEATLDDLLGLGATDGDVDSDLLVTADTEGTDGEACFACISTPSVCHLPRCNAESVMNSVVYMYAL